MSIIVGFRLFDIKMAQGLKSTVTKSKYVLSPIDGEFILRLLMI